MAIIKLFDIENEKVVLTEHCYTIDTLKVIIDEYPEDHLKIFLFCFYMSCPDRDENPFFNIDELDKEEFIYKHIDAEFSLEDENVMKALEFCKEMYTTVTVRSYIGFKTMLDRLSEYMRTTAISHGRDGNINSIVSAGKNYAGLKESFKAIEKDLEEENKNTIARGGTELGYDQQ